MRCEGDILFQRADHASPATQSEQFLRDEGLPLILWQSEFLKRLEDDVFGFHLLSLLPHQGCGNSAEMSRKHGQRLRHDAPHGFEQTLLAQWHWPVGDALIEVGTGEADQWRMNQQIDVDAVVGEHRIARPLRCARRGCGLRLHAGQAGVPQRLGCVHAEHAGGGGGQVRAEGGEPVPFFDLPGDVDAVRTSRARDEHDAPELLTRDPAREDGGVGLAPEDVINVFIQDTLAGALGLVGFLGQKGLGTEEVAAFDHCFFKPLVLE